MALLLVECGSSIGEVTPDESPSFDSVHENPSFDSVNENPSFDSVHENPSFDSVGGDGFLGLT